MDELSTTLLAARFKENYETIYGHLPPDVPLEVVGLRARVVRQRENFKLTPVTNDTGSEGDPALSGNRQVYFEAAGGRIETAVYNRYRLARGEVFAGPAVIEEHETSIVVGPDASFFVDASANVVIEFGE